MFKDKKVHFGLSLSGGGSRGLAHLGVLKAMEDAGIKPEVISGTSMGAILGAFVAAGHSIDTIIQIALDAKGERLFNVQRSMLGLVGLDRIRAILVDYLPDDFSALKIPLFISTTNLTRGENEMFSSGPLLDAILASMAIPVVFKPMKLPTGIYVDGGLTNNMPARAIRDQCTVLIGSHVNYLEANADINNVKHVIERCFQMAIFNTVANEKTACDIYIDPPELRSFKTLNFDNAEQIIDLGYSAAKEVFQQKAELLKKKSVLEWLRQWGS